MVRMKWTNPWRAFHAEHIVNTQQNKQKHTTSHTLNMLCCKSPSAHWWNSKEIEIHTKQQLFYSVSLTLQGSQPLLLHPVSNERQGRGGGDLRVHPMKKIQVQILELKLYPASMEEATVLRREKMICWLSPSICYRVGARGRWRKKRVVCKWWKAHLSYNCWVLQILKLLSIASEFWM